MKHKVYSSSVTVLGDLQTPVGIYLKIRDLYPESVLLESSDFHSGENSYSFIGFKPAAHFSLDKGLITKEYPNGMVEKTEVTPSVNVPDVFQSFIQSFELEGTCQTANINGFFGYTSYDAVSCFESVNTRKDVSSETSIPEMMYIYYRYIIIVNHFKDELTLVENLFEGEESNMQSILNLLEMRNFAIYDFHLNGKETSFITDKEYMDMVSRGIEHCKRGDVFQIVLSRCFRQSFTGDDFMVYRSLRSVNPSPYLFYFDFGSFRIFGSSPETHCCIKNGKAYIDPIAGTVPRTDDETKDRELAEKLLQDPKENAEHVMLVDLARNDLSRNASNVQVEFYREIQYYSHVIHMVSRVSGEVNPGSNPIRIFANTFPAGTLSGAPKIRAMELIRDIEKHDRGFYGGCIGYIGLNGELNQAITIRSFMSRNNVLYYTAGAGIVNKSVETSELQEVNNKLGALKKAIDMAVKK
ncbi:MAG: anthranilate synthase component I family protein [Dysgonamonadaceae bacterium]|jgi:anthranilate synthase component 1|nr:anthranilate synthase component I family protein [Dysgonamonadaceae bacterium]